MLCRLLLLCIAVQIGPRWSNVSSSGATVQTILQRATSFDFCKGEQLCHKSSQSSLIFIHILISCDGKSIIAEFDVSLSFSSSSSASIFTFFSTAPFFPLCLRSGNCLFLPSPPTKPSAILSFSQSLYCFSPLPHPPTLSVSPSCSLISHPGV